MQRTFQPLYPNGSGLSEERDQGPPHLVAHELVRAADVLLADEHGGDDLAPPELDQRPLDLVPVGHLVKLVHRQVCAVALYQGLHGVAHAARAPAEYHHRLVLHEPRQRPVHATRR
ncbi:hypothetical protein BT93_H0752 [Corymbia citriodora subsp. variegata]|nr:hypothetical protein BT93_H0752 [Corymbia citriodora subsp. variegata]